MTNRQVEAYDYFVTPVETQALADVHGYASAGRIRIVSHARQRMRERGARFEDVRQALISATCCGPANDGKWKVTGGQDLDGDELISIVAIEDEVVVVTMF